MSRVMTVPFAFIFCASALSAQAAPHAVTVPFVGCNSMMQGEERPAPQGKPIKLSVDPQVASRLAFYQSASDDGVYAPRGWHCANLGGSNGWMLFVAPYPIKPDDFLMPHAHTVAGPFIQVMERYGGTSGRFDVARLIARYFPEQRGFARSVIAEKIEPASAFPSVPYAKDRLVSRKKGVVEYLTPPHAKGLGTEIWLKPDDQPILSTAMMSGDVEEPNAVVATIRLPKDMTDLAPIILHQAEQHYAATK